MAEGVGRPEMAVELTGDQRAALGAQTCDF
jgi:hypothetical protein